MARNVPEATKVESKAERSCQTQQRQPTVEMPSKLFDEMHDAGVLRDASQRGSAHYGTNPTPICYQGCLPYIVVQNGAVTCKAACCL